MRGLGEGALDVGEEVVPGGDELVQALGLEDGDEFRERLVEQAPYKKVLIGRGATNSKGPQMSQLNALRAIKASDKDARVLMVSALGQQKMIVEALEAGAMDFLVKPFQPTKVLETVKKCLQSAPR